jgi:hypothetical protein
MCKKVEYYEEAAPLPLPYDGLIIEQTPELENEQEAVLATLRGAGLLERKQKNET